MGEWAAAISASCAFLTLLIYMFSKRPSRREMVDILKFEILRVVSTLEGQKIWNSTVEESYRNNRSIGVSIVDLAGLLGKDYQKNKWRRLLAVAIQELKTEGNDRLLGMKDRSVIKGVD